MKKGKRLVILLLSLILVIGCTMSVSAATTSIALKEVGKGGYKKITKTGTYKLSNLPNYETGAVLFKAPKTGNYVFHFDKLSYKGEKSDMLSDAYWDPYSSGDYNREINVGIQSGSDKYGWARIDFDGSATYYVLNPHKLIYKTWLKGDFEDMQEAYAFVADPDVSQKDKMEYMDANTGTYIDLSLKLKKGQTVRILVQGDKTKTTCTLKVKRK